MDLLSKRKLGIILWCSYLCILRNQGMSTFAYSQTEAQCPDTERCDFTNTADILSRKCKCDINCTNYGDCCFDAGIPFKNNSQMQCVSYGHDDESAQGAYMIASCPDKYVGNKEVLLGCLNQIHISDPLMQIPVTDPVSGVTYRNRYCVECNSAWTPNLLSWLVGLKCEGKVSPQSIKKTLQDQIKPSEGRNTRGVLINGYSCKLIYDLPRYLSTATRVCNPNAVSSCMNGWDDISISMACEAYTAAVYVGDDIVFKNRHCAQCNGYSEGDIRCEEERRHKVDQKKRRLNFSLLLDVNKSDGDLVGISTPGGLRCGANQKYDPYFKVCRNLSCALPGYQLLNGKCKKPE